MEKKYLISGMTCTSCASKIKKAFEETPDVDLANVELESGIVTLSTKREIKVEELQQLLLPLGNYGINEFHSHENTEEAEMPEKSVSTYKPLLLIIAFITAVTLLAQYPFDNFSGLLWMRYFMAGFFIVFSFFKLLNLDGFVSSYGRYDLVAMKWKGWGYIYPFVELLLGLLYLINVGQPAVNWATVIILGIGSVGVIKSNLDKKKIKCACLGDFFNLPLSTVTIVEDVTMVLMAATMLYV